MTTGVVDLRTLMEELALRRIRGERVVLTNGVFDLLHVGHLRYLRAARAMGDVLVVGVNEDASVRQIKPGRPLVGQADRAELVAGLAPVDYAVLFSEPTADRLVEAIRPDVYVKGGDYTEETVPEGPTARSVGARIEILPLVPGRSTSELLDRLGG